MSISSLVQVFESGARASVAPHQSSLEFQDLVRHYLEVAEKDVVSQDAVPLQKPRTVISETGHYLVQVARILGNLTENLVQGPHTEAAIEAAHERSSIKSKTADINDISKMDVQHIKLREIEELVQKFSRDVRDVWNAGPPMVAVASQSSHSAYSPFGDTKQLSIKQSPSIAGDVDIKLHSIQHTLPSPQMPPGFLSSSTPNASGSDESSDEDEKFSNIDMEALRQRGKGSYYCPLGIRCKKGGVDKDGRPIRFDRNSSFAQHCNKHRKPWRCDIPGCPNPPKKRKFARRDGLDRHKATVKHGPSK